MGFRIATYNILDPYLAETENRKLGLNSNGKSNWDQRKEKIIENINSIQADILCLQEVNDVTFLDSSKYDYVTTSHNDPDRKDKLCIAFNPSRFKKLDESGLSSRIPNALNSTGLNKERSSLYVSLEDQITKRVIRIANCQLYPQSQGHLENVVNETDKFTVNPNAFIIAGDFSDPSSTQIGYISRWYKFDGNSSKTNGKSKSDMIWFLKNHGDNLTKELLIKPGVVKLPHEDASDHLPVISDIIFAWDLFTTFAAALDRTSYPNAIDQLQSILKEKCVFCSSSDSFEKLLKKIDALKLAPKDDFKKILSDIIAKTFKENAFNPYKYLSQSDILFLKNEILKLYKVPASLTTKETRIKSALNFAIDEANKPPNVSNPPSIINTIFKKKLSLIVSEKDKIDEALKALELAEEAFDKKNTNWNNYFYSGNSSANPSPQPAVSPAVSQSIQPAAQIPNSNSNSSLFSALLNVLQTQLQLSLTSPAIAAQPQTQPQHKPSIANASQNNQPASAITNPILNSPLQSFLYPQLNNKLLQYRAENQNANGINTQSTTNSPSSFPQPNPTNMPLTNQSGQLLANQLQPSNPSSPNPLQPSNTPLSNPLQPSNPSSANPLPPSKPLTNQSQAISSNFSSTKGKQSSVVDLSFNKVNSSEMPKNQKLAKPISKNTPSFLLKKAVQKSFFTRLKEFFTITIPNSFALLCKIFKDIFS